MKVADYLDPEKKDDVMQVAFHPKGCHPSAQTLGSRKKNGVMKVADTGSFMTVSAE